jgi:hypothetical protein
MSLKEKTKNEIKKKFKKIVFKIIKPFIPFIIVIFLIVLAVCTVVDSMFTTEDDMQMAEKLSSEDYEAQYAEWLKDKETTPSTVIIDGKGLVPTRYVYLANTWLYINYITFWNANSSNYRSL